LALADFNIRVADNVPCHAIRGILADVMGLGKTLSILSAIVSSRLTSVSYQDATASKIQGDMVFPTVLKSRATLIVVTSIRKSVYPRNSGSMSLTFTRGLGRLEEGNSNVSQDLSLFYLKVDETDNNDSHLKQDTLSYMVFHGDGRPKLPECVTEHDLVLTTYATLVADCKGPGVLQKIAWFRVVLDEGKATDYRFTIRCKC
jgi:SNF2 family DNA or RNA helicase